MRSLFVFAAAVHNRERCWMPTQISVSLMLSIFWKLVINTVTVTVTSAVVWILSLALCLKHFMAGTRFRLSLHYEVSSVLLLFSMILCAGSIFIFDHRKQSTRSCLPRTPVSTFSLFPLPLVKLLTWHTLPSLCSSHTFSSWSYTCSTNILSAVLQLWHIYSHPTSSFIMLIKNCIQQVWLSGRQILSSVISFIEISVRKKKHRQQLFHKGSNSFICFFMLCWFW